MYMYVCKFMYVYIHTYVYMYIYVYIYIHTYIHKCYLNSYICVNIHIYAYVCTTHIFFLVFISDWIVYVRPLYPYLSLAVCCIYQLHTHIGGSVIRHNWVGVIVRRGARPRRWRWTQAEMGMLLFARLHKTSARPSLQGRTLGGFSNFPVYASIRRVRQLHARDGGGRSISPARSRHRRELDRASTLRSARRACHDDVDYMRAENYCSAGACVMHSFLDQKMRRTWPKDATDRPPEI